MIDLVFLALFLFLFGLPILINMIPLVKNKESNDALNLTDKIVASIMVAIVIFIVLGELIGDGRGGATIAFLENRTKESKVYMNGFLVENKEYVLYRLKRIKEESRGHKGAGYHGLDDRILSFLIEDENETIGIVLKERDGLGGEYFIYSPDLEGGYVGVIRNIFNKPIVLNHGNEVKSYHSMDELMETLNHTSL